jgi:hypothetical protein
MDFSQSWWLTIEFIFISILILFITSGKPHTLHFRTPLKFENLNWSLNIKNDLIVFLIWIIAHNVLWQFGKSCLIQTMSFMVTCEKTLSLQKITTQLNDETHIYIDVKVWHSTFSLWKCKFSKNINSNKV